MTGSAFRKRISRKFFEPFFSTKPVTGTGLRLGMVKKRVALYNGKIEVNSEIDRGTRLTVSLPVVSQVETI
jgi:signal transduction histidine kinase